MTFVRCKLDKLIQMKAGLLKDCRRNQGSADGSDRATTRCGAYGQSGLTLIELLIVIAIIGILSGIAIPLYIGQIEKARGIKAVAELDNLQLEIRNFELDYSRLPESLEEVTSGGLTDPWGNSYRYLNFAALEADPEEEAPDPGKEPKGKAKGKAKKGEAGGENSVRLDQFDAPLNSDYDLYSCGRDGRSAPSIDDPLSRDDIVRGHDGD
jgi:general secretion pathway protein G